MSEINTNEIDGQSDEIQLQVNPETSLGESVNAESVEKRFSQEEVEKIVSGRLQRYERKMAREMDNKLAALKSEHLPVPSEKTVEEDPVGFLNGLIEEQLQAKQAQIEQKKADAIAQKQTQEFVKKLEVAQSKYKDLEEVIENVEEWSPHIVEAAQIAPSNNAEVIYFLGKNPQEHERIKMLLPNEQKREVIKLAARLNSASTINSSAPAPLTTKNPSPAVSGKESNSYASAKARAIEMQRRRHSKSE